MCSPGGAHPRRRASAANTLVVAAMLMGAESALGAVLVVDNALDAVARGGGEVSVRARHRGRWVVVEVMDDGPGVPDDISDRIFDAFFTTKGVGEGAGLGLEIVRGVLSRHSGDIELESEPGRTVFRVSLPAR